MNCMVFVVLALVFNLAPLAVASPQEADGSKYHDFVGVTFFEDAQGQKNFYLLFNTQVKGEGGHSRTIPVLAHFVPDLSDPTKLKRIYERTFADDMAAFSEGFDVTVDRLGNVYVMGRLQTKRITYSLSANGRREELVKGFREKFWIAKFDKNLQMAADMENSVDGVFPFHITDQEEEDFSFKPLRMMVPEPNRVFAIFKHGNEFAGSKSDRVVFLDQSLDDRPLIKTRNYLSRHVQLVAPLSKVTPELGVIDQVSLTLDKDGDFLATFQIAEEKTNQRLIRVFSFAKDLAERGDNLLELYSSSIVTPELGKEVAENATRSGVTTLAGGQELVVLTETRRGKTFLQKFGVKRVEGQMHFPTEARDVAPVKPGISQQMPMMTSINDQWLVYYGRDIAGLQNLQLLVAPAGHIEQSTKFDVQGVELFSHSSACFLTF